MFKKFLRSFFRFILHIYFRTYEVSGTENIPTTGAMVLVLNHPNALIDPVVVFSLCPREVYFLAKSTLFSMPVISFFVNAFGAIPVYRQQEEGFDPQKTQEMFKKVREHLKKGGGITVFPEGTTHSDPKLRKLKTGAARMALLSAQDQPVYIVPASLFFYNQGRFRSEAVLTFGPPVVMEKRDENPNDPVPQDLVKSWTDKIAKALSEVVLQADEAELIELSQAAQQILGEEGMPLPAQLSQQKKILVAYERLKQERPKEIGQLRKRIRRYLNVLNRYEMKRPKKILTSYGIWQVVKYLVKNVTYFLVLFPLAFVGAVIHLPVYFLTDHLAKRMAKGEMDMLSTLKLITGLVFYPILWFLVAIGVGYVWEPATIPLIFGITPLLGGAALIYWERFENFRLEAILFRLFLFQKRSLKLLAREREEIRKKLFDLQSVIS